MPEPTAAGVPQTSSIDDLIKKLSNRINDIEARLEKNEAENKKSYVDHPTLDARSAEYRKEIESLKQTISELQEKKKEVIAETKPADDKKPDDPNRPYKDGLDHLSIID